LLGRVRYFSPHKKYPSTWLLYSCGISMFLILLYRAWLGIKCWLMQLNKTSGLCRSLVQKLKFLRRFLTNSELTKVVTAQFFSRLYYGAEVWIHEMTLARTLRVLNSLHYKALRLWRLQKLYLKSRTGCKFKKGNPYKQWSLFVNCKMAINLMSGNTPLGIKLRAKSYINDRKPGRATIMDSSRWKIGRFSLSNRLLCLKRVNFDWCHGLSSDNLRINLKKCFIPVFQDFFVTFDIMISFLSLLTESYIVFY